MKIAITGSSGNIGGMVARHLNSRSLPLILPLRNPAQAPDLTNCEARRFAYGDLELAKQALNGGVLFMVSAAESPTREQEHLTLVQAALVFTPLQPAFFNFVEASLSGSLLPFRRPFNRDYKSAISITKWYFSPLFLRLYSKVDKVKQAHSPNCLGSWSAVRLPGN